MGLSTNRTEEAGRCLVCVQCKFSVFPHNLLQLLIVICNYLMNLPEEAACKPT